jgi:hypothetical protein
VIELPSEQRAAVLAEYDRISRLQPPKNLRGGGCALAVLGTLMLVGLPPFLADKHQSDASKAGMFVFVITLIVVGIWVFIRGNRAGRWLRRQTRAALEEMERFAVLTPEERAAWAVRLLFYGLRSGYGVSPHSLNTERLREHIPEDALHYVMQVEAVVNAKRWQQDNKEE